MKQIHETQLHILNKLLFAESLRYTDMRPQDEIENNRFDFHVKTLIKEGFIEKSEDQYVLTLLGKEYANRIDTDQVKVKIQAKISVMIGALREYKGRHQVLVYTRLKNPFYGKQGFVSGKLDYGEEVLLGAARELKEETGLDGEPVLVKVYHYINKDKQTQRVIEDKFMYFCRIIEPKGKLMGNNEGDFEWINLDEVDDKITNHFDSLEVFKEELNELTNFHGQISFEEIVQYPDGF